MRKALLILIFISALPVVSSAESLHLNFAVHTSQDLISDNTTNYVRPEPSQSIRYIANNGFGLGFTDVALHLSNNSGVSGRINFRALEVSYTARILTFGVGKPITGSFVSESGSTKNSGRVHGVTSFVTLALKTYDKGSLLIGYHVSKVDFFYAHQSQEEIYEFSRGSRQNYINNVMLGFQIPL
jgi:hypothetical protein